MSLLISVILGKTLILKKKQRWWEPNGTFRIFIPANFPQTRYAGNKDP